MAAADNRIIELELLPLVLVLLVFNLLLQPLLLLKLLMLLMDCIRCAGRSNVFPGELLHACTADNAAVCVCKNASVRFNRMMITNHKVTCRDIVNEEGVIAIRFVRTPVGPIARPQSKE